MTSPGDHLDPFEVVVQRHGPAVLRVCRAVVGPDAAEDAWSETFLAALRAYPDLPPGSDVRAWLLTIAHRKGIDAWRARQRRPVPVEALPDVPAAGPAPGDGLHDATAGLLAAVAALPPKQRACVAHHHLGGLSHAETAAVLGGTEQAARRACADGIAALRRSWHRARTEGEEG